ncbi:MAG: hypothetical protein WBC92_01975 [Terracidiphilus sp.]
MRRMFLLSFFALLVVCAANDACAQRHGGAGVGFARGGFSFSRARGSYGFNRARRASRYGYGYANQPYGFGYAALPYDSGYLPYDSDAYGYSPQPVVLVQQSPVIVQPPAPPVARPVGHAVITNYTWPAADMAPSPSESEPQTFALVLKNGSTISAVAVFASDDGLHYVDPDERHLRISMSKVDRAATLRLNRAKNLNLYLPAPQ